MARFRPQRVPLRREDGHLPLSIEPDTDTQTTLPQRSCCVLCSETGSLRCLCPEDALYEPPATSRLASSARRRVPTHAAASDPGMKRPRRFAVGPPFSSPEYHIFGHSRLPLPGLKGAPARVQL